MAKLLKDVVEVTGGHGRVLELLHHTSWHHWIAPVLIAYVLLVRTLRYRRRDALTARYSHGTKRDLTHMTPAEAQDIIKTLTEQEFPWSMGAAMGFALFKTFAIPTISALLVATGEFSPAARSACPGASSRRAADTLALLLEAVLNPPTCPRARAALARMNFLHARHRRAGRIADADMLYTLGLFAREPRRWVAAHEWRPLSAAEVCALGVFWRAVGHAMRIPFDALGVSGDVDGVAWLDAVEHWSAAYEAEHMRPATSNVRLARARLDGMFVFEPRASRAVLERVLAVLLGPRLRDALGIAEPGAGWRAFVDAGMAARRFALRWCALPRLRCMRQVFISAGAEAEARHFLEVALPYPFYVKPTLWQRLGPDALLARLCGGKVPGDDGDAYAPHGYVVHELGPDAQRGKGREEMRADEVSIARAFGD